MVAYPGHAIETMPIDMRLSVRMGPASSMSVRISPENHRTERPHQKPAPNVISDNMSELNGFRSGKRPAPIAEA
jgi:hypothetical protein